MFDPTILADPVTGRLRMWYIMLPSFKPGEAIPHTPCSMPKARMACTGKSRSWISCPDGDHARTNIVYRGANNNCSAACIVIDPNEADPARKYKMLHKGGTDKNGVLGEELAFSPDGLHWQPYAGNPVMPMRHDCNLNLLYNPARKLWTAYGRPYAWANGRWLPGDHPRRRIAVTESPDLIHWSKVRTVIAPREGDSNEFNDIAVFPCGNVLVGLVGIFQVVGGDQHRQLSCTSSWRSASMAYSGSACRAARCFFLRAVSRARLIKTAFGPRPPPSAIRRPAIGSCTTTVNGVRRLRRESDGHRGTAH